MLQAQLRGKLTRREEDLEDVLTSDVFGSIKYIPPQEALVPLLASSEDSSGNAPIHIPQHITSVMYRFWPWIHEPDCKGCEPDVSIEIKLANGEKIIIFVEAKYLSEKSSEANGEVVPTDQLAREWDNLTCLASREKATPILLYVTADIGYPEKSIEDSCLEYQQKRRKDMRVFWVSWRKLPGLFHATKHEILKDLVRVLQRQALVFFEGIMKPDPIEINWSFRTVPNWTWSSYEEYAVRWRYEANRTYIWQYKTKSFDWRFRE